MVVNKGKIRWRAIYRPGIWRVQRDDLQNPSTGSGQRLLVQLKEWLRTEEPFILHNNMKILAREK